MRTALGILAGVAVWIAAPVAFIVLASFPEPPPEEGDAYVRGAIGLLALLPGLFVVALAYHGVAAALAQALPDHRAIALTVLAALTIAGATGLLMAADGFETWSRTTDTLLVVTLPVAVLCLLGTLAQYTVAFRRRA